MNRFIDKNAITSPSKTRVFFFLFCICLIQTVQAATLSGSFANASAEVNLSSDAPLDWIHWGYVPLEIDRKSGVTPQITDFTPVGGADPGAIDTVSSGYSWTDGLSPASQMSSTHTGERVFQVGRGFEFSVPAGTARKSLRVYVGAYSAMGTLTATLSDGSAPAYTTQISASSGGQTSQVVTINFNSASDGKKLVIKYVVAANITNGSYITLESAALTTATGGGSTGYLSGSIATAPSDVNLSAAGSIDWVHWGRISDQPRNRKAKISPLISELDTVGFEVYPIPNDSASAYSWSDGVPDSSVSKTNSGLSAFKRDKGFKISVPADTTTRTLKVYVGVNNNAYGKFTATLSDGSAAAYTQTFTQTSRRNSFEVVLKYQAASNNQRLTITYVRTNDLVFGSWISMEAAKLYGTNPGPDAGQAPASPPEGLIASDNTYTNKIAVNWNPVSGATFYQLFRSTSSGSNGSQISSQPGANFDDTSAVEGNVYYYRVKACNIYGCSGFSSQESGVIAGTSGGNAGSLNGAVAAALGSINLNNEGSSDWIHWGLNSASDVNRKAGVTMQISNFLAVEGATPSQGNSVSTYSWSNGTPVNSVSNSNKSLRVFGVAKGFEFTVPADTSLRTLKVYIGATNARGRLVASLSDDSAPDYTTAIDQPSGSSTRTVTLKFKAGAAGKKLVVRYVVETKYDATNSWIDLSAAALTAQEVASNLPPALQPISDQTISEGQSYYAKVVATDADGPAPIKLTESNNLPGNPVVLTDLGGGYGELRWTPSVGDAAATPYAITVIATDGDGAQISKTTKVAVNARTSGSTGAISGSLLNAPTSANLTSEGTVDWIHWGLTSNTDVDRMTGIVPKISDFTPVGGALTPQTSKTKTSYSWSNGSPTKSISNSTTGLQIFNVGKGFEFSAAADTSLRTLKVYIGANRSRGRLVASLSDKSSSDFVTLIDQSGSAAGKIVALSYKAASANQLLRVSFVMDHEYDTTNGWISLESATLQGTNSSAGSSLSGTAILASANVNLSMAGPVDWVHWGLNTKTDVDRKANVVPKISNFIPVENAIAPQTNQVATAYSWSGGSPTNSASNTKTGLQVFHVGKGFEFTVPASTVPQTLKVYVGAKEARGRLIASLSDSSVAEYTVAIDQANGASSRVITLSFQASSSGKSLKIKYVLESKPVDGSGWISLESAALM